MGVVVRHPITFYRDDYDVVDKILKQFYERGDVDSVTVEDYCIDGRRAVRFWLECGQDDLMAVRDELTNHGVELK